MDLNEGPRGDHRVADAVPRSSPSRSRAAPDPDRSLHTELRLASSSPVLWSLSRTPMAIHVQTQTLFLGGAEATEAFPEKRQGQRPGVEVEGPSGNRAIFLRDVSSLLDHVIF